MLYLDPAGPPYNFNECIILSLTGLPGPVFSEADLNCLERSIRFRGTDIVIFNGNPKQKNGVMILNHNTRFHSNRNEGVQFRIGGKYKPPPFIVRRYGPLYRAIYADSIIWRDVLSLIFCFQFWKSVVNAMEKYALLRCHWKLYVP